MLDFRKWHRRFEDCCAAASGIIIFCMMILSTMDIFGRYLILSPIPGVYELLELSLPAAAYLAFAYVQRNKGNIVIEFIIEKLRPEMVARLNIFVLTATLGICAIITWRTGIEAGASYRAGEYVFGLIKYPLFPSRAIVSFGMGLLCLRLIADLIGQIRKPLGKAGGQEINKGINHGA